MAARLVIYFKLFKITRSNLICKINDILNVHAALHILFPKIFYPYQYDASLVSGSTVFVTSLMACD